MRNDPKCDWYWEGDTSRPLDMGTELQQERQKPPLSPLVSLSAFVRRSSILGSEQVERCPGVERDEILAWGGNYCEI